MYLPVDIKMKIHKELHQLKLKEVHAELDNTIKNKYILLHPSKFNVANVMIMIKDHYDDIYENPDYELEDTLPIVLTSMRHGRDDILFKQLLHNSMNVIQKYKNKIQTAIDNKRYYRLRYLYDNLAYDFAYCFYVGSD